MNLNTNIKVIQTWLSALGLALILLLAPCSVRNYFQSTLDIPLTEVTNKSKSTINTANCSISEIEEVQNSLPQLVKQYSPVLLACYISFNFHTQILISVKTVSKEIPIQSDTIVPYYILYQNLKIHLS